MPKNAIQRLQKIEKDLKTVISIYEISKRCKRIGNHGILEDRTLLVEKPQETQCDFLSENNTPPPSTDVYSIETVQSSRNFITSRSVPLSLSSTTCEVSHIKPKETEDYSTCKQQDPVRDADEIKSNLPGVILLTHSRKSDKENKSTKNITGRSFNVTSKEYPDWLVPTTSNWFGSIKHNFNQEKSSSNISLIPNTITKNVQKRQSQEKKNTMCPESLNRNSQEKVRVTNKDNMNNEKAIKSKKTKKIQSTPKWRNSIPVKKNESTIYNENVQLSQAPDANDTQKTSQASDNEFWNEKSNEKLKKMKVSKKLALDIAKHLKEKYDKIQRSKQEMMEKCLLVQEDNERLKKELKEMELKLVELQKFKTKQWEQDFRNTEILEKDLQALKARLRELKKEHHEELLAREREIDKIQRVRLEEIRKELENREHQAKEIQQLTNEKCELLAINDELEILLSNYYTEKQYLEEKNRQLEDEIQMEKQQHRKKTEELEEKNTELKSLCQRTTDLEAQVKILKKNNEKFEETQNSLISKTEEYEKKAKLNQEIINKLQSENSTLKTELENERDGLLIKTKIIEDQQETIKQLKEKSEEAKTLMRRKESLERILKTERDEKLQLEDAVERLKRRKEELKNKIKVLENDLLTAPEKVAQDLQKTQEVLFELENQVYNKQKEWELQFHSLIREKEQACRIAEYATKKLIETSNEFQKESEAPKRLCRGHGLNLAKREQIC